MLSAHRADLDRVTNQGYSHFFPTSGMIALPKYKTQLKGPIKLARIGHSSKKGIRCTHEENLSSPWWMSEGDMEELFTRSRDSGTPLAKLIRQQACIPKYWESACDRIYEVTLQGRVDCYIAKGCFFFPEKSAPKELLDGTSALFPKGDIVFYPSNVFNQINIPGLWDKDVRGHVWATASWIPITVLEKSESFTFSPKRRIF